MDAMPKGVMKICY